MSEFFYQPDFYRFNEDSIRLVDFVLSELREKFQENLSVLDLCAGCGIIGIDFYIKATQSGISFHDMTFIEKNKKFKEFLEKNQVSLLDNKIPVQNLFTAFEDLKLSKKFDLILANPPYFNESHHRKSQNPDRMTARSYSGEFMQDFIFFIKSHLKKEGQAVFLFPNLESDKLESLGAKKVSMLNDRVSLFVLHAIE